MLTSRGRFSENRVVDVTKLVDPLVPVHGVVGFPDPDGLLDVVGPLVGFDNTTNRDEGAHQLCHIYDPFRRKLGCLPSL